MRKFIEDIRDVGFEEACHRLPYMMGFPVFMVMVSTIVIFSLTLVGLILVPPVFWFAKLWLKVWGIA